MKRKESARVLSQECLAPGIFSLWLETGIGDEAVPGQFVSLYSRDGSRLLPRPISLCEIGDGRIRLVYRVAGAGTEEFSTLRPGDAIEVLGPLGNGFPLEEARTPQMALRLTLPCQAPALSILRKKTAAEK